MILRRLLLSLALLAALSLGASGPRAQLTTTGAGGAPNVTPPTPCSAGQFDFSQGCNAVFFTGVMGP